jgi:hypothetical protein
VIINTRFFQLLLGRAMLYRRSPWRNVVIFLRVFGRVVVNARWGSDGWIDRRRYTVQ